MIVEFMKTYSFISSKPEGDVKIVGIPLDITQTFRSGTREAPDEIRRCSDSIEDYSPVLDKDLRDKEFTDLGNIILPMSLQALEYIFNATKEIKHPICLGGEHLITYPVVKALKKRYRDIVVLQLDAHLDLRDEYFGEKFSHATVMRRVLDLGIELYQLGIRSGYKEEYEFARKNGTIINSIEEFDTKKPVYITFDIDVLDPAYAPGVTNPEPCGMSTEELFNIIYKLDCDVVGFDVVEVAPIYDPASITAVTAAKIVRECILKFF